MHLNIYTNSLPILSDWFRLGTVAHYTLIITYSTFIIFGIVGNLAIVLAFLTNKVYIDR